ncbi:LOW QUALITY PROTEIN: hypothetical protein Cgig2_033640 [Carnegiea gigantea]|uniref:Aminotransferase-like plant mobile domain-containing protein n=1 Tax=Carnegiea gigantea TaxID=171969 RepID=A0A9Q1K3J9_9CARY|nr:LOW QUALITY PROTEIN: hypothetical protein Cgig2_033640 [Carnegiea gigantea]
MDSEKGKVETKKRSPLCISHQEQMTDLNVTTEGELTAFLAFWLSRFVLPHGKEVIRPETFVMAALMAYRQQISLAPTVLGYIYHGLGEAASHPNHLGKANTIFPNTIFPIHYVTGWLAELSPSPFCRRPDSDCLGDFLILFIIRACLVANFHYPKLDTDGRYLSLSASSYREDSRTRRDVIDMGLLDEDFKFLLSIRSSVLPVHPYYPNRFAHQFGFDQGVPSNRLGFIRALQQQRNVMDLAQAYANIQRRDIG